MILPHTIYVHIFYVTGMVPTDGGRQNSFPTGADITGAWFQSSSYLFISLLETNRAIVAAFGGPSLHSSSDRTAPQNDEIAYSESEWTVERSIEIPDNLSIGDSITFSKQITDDDVEAFARASGDTNRLHLETEFAETTRFEGRIVHGTLLSGLISAALARLPGLTVYLSQDTEFTNPLPIGETATAACEVVEKISEDTYRLTTRVSTEESDPLIEGEAVVLIDELLPTPRQ